MSVISARTAGLSGNTRLTRHFTVKIETGSVVVNR